MNHGTEFHEFSPKLTPIRFIRWKVINLEHIFENFILDYIGICNIQCKNVYHCFLLLRVKEGGLRESILIVWLFCVDTLETVWQDGAQCSGLWWLWTYCWSVDRRDLCGWVAAVFCSSYSVCLITCLFVLAAFTKSVIMYVLIFCTFDALP